MSVNSNVIEGDVARLFAKVDHRPQVERLYTKRESAAITGLSLETINRILARREIATVRIGTSVRISESALAEFIRSRTMPAANAVVEHDTRTLSATATKPRARKRA